MDVGRLIQVSHSAKLEEEAKERIIEDHKQDALVAELCQTLVKEAEIKCEEWKQLMSTAGKAGYTWQELGLENIGDKVATLHSKQFEVLQQCMKDKLRLQITGDHHNWIIVPYLPEDPEVFRRRRCVFLIGLILLAICITAIVLISFLS